MQKLNLEEAAKAARLSQWAYYHHNQFTRLVTDLFGELPDEVHFIEDRTTDTQVYVINHGDVSWVAFRGTESIKDALIDMDFSKSHHSTWSGKVHDGFAGAFISVWGRIIKATNEQSRLIITGHSLGAALAILASPCINSDSITYAFCPPRVGDSEFADYTERYSNIFCFTRHKDPVARVPPYWIGYRHVGQQCYFHSDGRFDLHATPWERYVDAVFGDMKEYLIMGDALADHSIEWIADRLEELSNGNI